MIINNHDHTINSNLAARQVRADQLAATGVPRPAPSSFSKAPKGNGIGATGSKNPRAYQNPCCSLLGMVLRTWLRFSKTPVPLYRYP